MVFSSTANKNGIIQNCESLCSLGDAGITGNTILFAKFAGYVNQANLKVVSAIIAMDKRWAWDDSNYSDRPRATATLEASQKDYILPKRIDGADTSTLLRVNKVAVLDTNSTPQERVLTLTDLSEAELNNIYSTNGLPTYYKLIGDSVEIWPATSSTYCTLTNGLIVYFQRSPDPFTSSDTTQEPSFPVTFHDLLQLDASATYLLPTNPNLAATYLALFNNRLNLLQEEYAHRSDDNPNRIVPKYRNPR